MTKLEELKKVIEEVQPKKIWVFPHIGEKTRQPIQLADILIALNRISEDRNYDAWLIGGNGYFYKLELEFEVSGIFWNLKENLDGQNKETISFLHDLLVKN